MKVPAKRATSSGSGADTAEGPITAANYEARAMAHMRSSGRSNGDHPVIRSVEAAVRDRKPATPEQWRSWLGYWAVLGLKTAFVRRHGVATVPTEWPWQFDVLASTEIPPQPYAQPRLASRDAGPLLDRLASEVGLAAPPRRRRKVPAEMTTPEAKTALERLSGEVPRLNISPELRQSLGLPPEQQREDAA